MQKIELKPWTMQLVQGHVESVESSFAGKELIMTLVSRRRFEMAGTRYNARGIDENGNCANFVESELVVEYPSMSLIFSHVQVRGSVPLFWS
jgi:synaptojanin